MGETGCCLCGGGGVLPSRDPSSPSTRDCECKLPIEMRAAQLTGRLNELHAYLSNGLKASEVKP